MGFLSWSACCADIVRAPGPLSPALVGSGLSDAAVCGDYRTRGHSGCPLVAENVTFPGEQDLVSLQGGRIGPCLDLSVARVSCGDRHEAGGSRGATGWKRNRGQADGAVAAPHGSILVSLGSGDVSI